MNGIAVAQFAPGPDRDANLDVMRGLAATAAQRGATLVVFPEYSSYFTPTMGPDWIAAAEAIDGPFATGLASIAAAEGITVVAGMLEAAGEKAQNTVLAIAATGERLALSRKLHLYDAFGDNMMDYSTRAAAARAGFKQGQSLADGLGDFWRE